jgi:hypothetical protein
MPNEKFTSGLKDLSYEVEVLSESRVVISYTPFDGKLKGKLIKVGIEVPPDFEMTPPTGLHISPALLVINESAPTHPERVAVSPFGKEWQYLSRPYEDRLGKKWKDSKRTVEAYMCFAEDILNTL